MSYKIQRQDAAHNLAMAIDDLIDVRLKDPYSNEDLRGISELAMEILEFMEKWEKAK